jgi:hypothetical protein
VSVLWGEAKLGRELLSDLFTEKEGDGSAALLVEGGLKSASNGILARVVKAHKEKDNALLVTWRVTFSENFDDFPVDLCQQVKFGTGSKTYS